eukprot:6463222-Amphidinium_carterae.1
MFVNVGQNPKIGSSIKQTQHTQLCEGSLKTFPALSLQSESGGRCPPQPPSAKSFQKQKENKKTLDRTWENPGLGQTPESPNFKRVSKKCKNSQ